MPRADLHINLLGLMKITHNGDAVDFPPSRKTRALLGYLIVANRPYTRQHLCELLWEGPADPRAALRWSLSKIRELLDNQKHHLVTEQNQVMFRKGSVEVDYHKLLKLKAKGLQQVALTDLDFAGSVQGVFLEDCELPKCYKYDAWLTAQRESMVNLQKLILKELITRLNNHPAQALKYARKLLLLDIYDESAHINLIHLLNKLNHKEEALKQYYRCRKIFKFGLHTPPSPALEQARRMLFDSSGGSKIYSERCNQCSFSWF